LRAHESAGRRRCQDVANPEFSGPLSCQKAAPQLPSKQAAGPLFAKRFANDCVCERFAGGPDGKPVKALELFGEVTERPKVRHWKCESESGSFLQVIPK
jgi:hypothetical protein